MGDSDAEKGGLLSLTYASPPEWDCPPGLVIEYIAQHAQLKKRKLKKNKKQNKIKTNKQKHTHKKKTKSKTNKQKRNKQTKTSLCNTLSTISENW